MGRMRLRLTPKATHIAIATIVLGTFVLGVATGLDTLPFFGLLSLCLGWSLRAGRLDFYSRVDRHRNYTEMAYLWTEEYRP